MPIGIDYETFGTRNLKVVGLDNYINDPQFRPLIASISDFVTNDDGDDVMVDTRYDFVVNSDERRALTPEEQRVNMDAFSMMANRRMQVAHNAGFERAVHTRTGLCSPEMVEYDSAVIARAVGAGEHLAAAAPQLLGIDKMPDGARLIQKFSIPQKDGYVYIDHVSDWTDEDWADWKLFGDYCDLDARLSLMILDQWGFALHDRELHYEKLTQRMNTIGWPVDTDLVHAMAAQRDSNLVRIEENFHRVFPDEGGNLNFRSTPQLREWCRKRGINATSFDELHVEQLLKRINSRIDKLYATGSQTPRIQKQISDYTEVRYMLRVKQELGGSSLSKLDTILNLVGEDGRLRNQYMHIGAGQTFRASGRGAQLQNLKKLGAVPGDVEDQDLLEYWENDELARNIRQVFCASHTDGQIIVGDLKSVESRGLAYIAGADWKLDAYHQGKDMYMVQASSMLGIPYDQITKEQRTTGKVGELSCGYGAGDGAIARFAEKMHVAMTEEQAGEVKTTWRAANPEAVQLWRDLDIALHNVVELKAGSAGFKCGPNRTWWCSLISESTPESLLEQNPDAKTISMTLRDETGMLILRRWFQGCFMDGNDVCYHQPSELKGGPLWRDMWRKDGKSGRYKLYGGKLTGILIQSFCREIFYRGLSLLAAALHGYDNVQIIGQFHDEIVVEWWPTPGGISLEDAMAAMRKAMSDRGLVPGFPLDADVHSDKRYIK